MKKCILLFVIFFGLASVCMLYGDDGIKIMECMITRAKESKTTGSDASHGYNLHLNLRCELETKKSAVLKITVNPEEEAKFETVEERRLQRGLKIVEYDIPLKELKTPKLRIFIFIQNNNPKPDEVPLASVTKVYRPPFDAVQR